MTEVLVGTDDNFEGILQSTTSVLVDFWAEWCIPCKQLDPIMDRLAARSDLVVVKVDADAAPLICEKYWVAGLPAILLFHNGELVARRVGLASQKQLEGWVEESMPTSSRQV